MATGKTVEQLLQSAGKGFFLGSFEHIYRWSQGSREDKSELIAYLRREWGDSHDGVTRTRINSSLNIIDRGCSREAFGILCDPAKRFAKHECPDVRNRVAKILAAYPEL